MISSFKPISFEWDKGNIVKNWEKHKVSNDECEQIFANKPLKMLIDKSHSQVEERLVAYGTTDKGRRLAVFFTIRKLFIRVISARDQDKKERKYMKQNKIKPIPKFKNEDAERDFWATHSSTDYFDTKTKSFLIYRS